MKKLFFGAAAIFCAAAASPAFAWHARGHMIVAALAWSKLTDGRQCTAYALLNSNRTYATYHKDMSGAVGIDSKQALFVYTATWPDRIKQGPNPTAEPDDVVFKKVSDTPPDPNTPEGKLANVNRGLGKSGEVQSSHSYWHFADYRVPLPKSKPNDPPPKPENWSNAEDEITNLWNDLKSSSTSSEQKAYALAWLIHLVGDVHQPLHAAEQRAGAFASRGDAGGNSVVACVPTAKNCDMERLCPDGPKKCRPPNLHSYWDGLPGESESVKSAITAAADLAKEPVQPDASDMVVRNWVLNSNRLAAKYAYVAPVVRGSTGPFLLTGTYEAKARPQVKTQLKLAGARLATILNQSLAPNDHCS